MPLTPKTLSEAEDAARAFLQSASELRKTYEGHAMNENAAYYGTRQTGTVRRRSMDLSQALVVLRRSN